MTTKMIDAITVTRNKIFKGAARVVARVSTTVPAKLEDIMQSAAGSSPYTLASGWIDLGPTSEDGLSMTRSASLSDGIKVDQRVTALDKGEPETWEHGAECTLMHTHYTNLVYALEYGTTTALGADTGRVAQHKVAIDAPDQFTERQFAFIQEDIKSNLARAWWFRKVIPAVDGEIALKATEASGVPLKLTINQDETVSEGDGQFGLLFEEDD